MTRFVALFHSVVLSPTRRIKSGELLEMAARERLAVSRTVLSTGNLIFDAEAEEAALERRLEQACFAVCGRAIPVFVRSAADWRALIAANPFPEITTRNPSRAGVRVMRRHPDPATIARIAAKAGPGESFATTDRALWLATETDLSASPLLRAAGAVWAGEGTLRNLSAVARIAAALGV